MSARSSERAGRRRNTRSAQRRRGRRRRLAEPIFPALAERPARPGRSVLLAVAEVAEQQAEVRFLRVEDSDARGGRGREWRFAGRGVELSALARLLGGLGHAHRLRIALAILRGKGRQTALSDAVGLRAGPLYHHLRELERCGVIHSPRRGEYELTPAGRDGLLVGLAVGHGLTGGSWQRVKWHPAKGGKDRQGSKMKGGAKVR